MHNKQSKKSNQIDLQENLLINKIISYLMVNRGWHMAVGMSEVRLDHGFPNFLLCGPLFANFLLGEPLFMTLLSCGLQFFV